MVGKTEEENEEEDSKTKSILKSEEYTNNVQANSDNLEYTKKLVHWLTMMILSKVQVYTGGSGSLKQILTRSRDHDYSRSIHDQETKLSPEESNCSETPTLTEMLAKKTRISSQVSDKLW